MFLLLPALIAAGCAALDPAPADRAPPLEIPADWQSRAGAGAVVGWLSDFRDPRLASAVEEALAGNFELRGAASRVRAARAQARIAGAETLPQLQLAAAASRSDSGATDSTGSSEGAVTTYQLSGQLSWEADLWGRLSDTTRAARADYQAAEADYQAARLSLAANIARQWFNVIEAQAQTRLARETVSSFDTSLETIENRYRQGIGEALDVRLARNNLATARANLAQRIRQQRLLSRGLEALLGRYPAGDLALPEALPDVEEPVPAGLPAGVLARRPDLLAAASRLRAAGYRAAAARKNHLPSLSLTAEGGSASDALREAMDLDNLVWTLAANLVQPIFQGGRLEGERELSRARDDEALNDYAQAVLDALREVEDALDAEDYLARQEQATRDAAREAGAAEALALEQYRRGLAGIITLLEAQRRKFNADSALIQVVNQRLQNRINLHLALGGDFTAGTRPEVSG